MRYLPFFAFFVFIFSCSGDYSPKPSGYFRIELEDPVYQEYKDSSSLFSFNIQQMAVTEVVLENKEGEWLDIVYPSLGAKIHCDFWHINSHLDLVKLSEDSRGFVYKHVVKADRILEQSYAVPEKEVYAIVYDVGGNVPSPVLFVITDSVQYFFRGSLYFYSIPNQDSIAPVKDYIRSDIEEIIKSFSWNRE